MKSIKVLVSSILVSLALGLHAQTTSCAHDMITEWLMMNNPAFYNSQMALETAVQNALALDPSMRTDEVYTIPVVVHVIHEGEPYGVGSNITDEQILSAINALNEDFRHMPGTNGYGAGPDIGIEFCLAVRNPQGQPTTGIVRVNGSSVPLYADNGIEASGGNGAIEEDVKALSTWPRESYMNVWVVNEIANNDAGAGIQGYAYFPINNPVDGIVVLFNAFGTVGNLKSYTNLNRTLTHEVGHYLNLYHTFNGTTSCTSETNCSTQGDRVCDTPPTPQAGSCSSPSCSGTQQVENYMDYTGQTCQDMFSEGQKLRMRTALETQRTSIITSLGCMPVYTLDIGISAVVNPSGVACPGALQPQVVLTNYGSTALTSATINYNTDGVGSNTQNWTGSLASGASVTITLPSISPSTGAHTFYAWTTSPNGSSDQNAANNQSSSSFTMTSGASATLDVVTDYYGSETTWQIADDNGVILLTGGPYPNGQQGVHNLTTICLADGCYTLTMNDAFGDGQGFTNGSFSLSSSTGTVLASGSGNWGDTSANDFCITSSGGGGGGGSSAPVAQFTIGDNTICRNSSTSFTNTSTNSPTSYSWTFEGGSPATSTSQNPSNISYANAGTYDVTLTVSNANGSNTYVCTNCMTVFAEPTVTVTGTNPTCNTSTNGSVSASATGNAPFTYSWNTGATGSSVSSLGAGTYTVTVTDANSCTKTGNTTLTAPTAISITGTSVNPLCAGQNNGSISVSASGGTGSKTFSWSNGASGANITNLAAGSYTVTATDANGCTKTQSFTLTAPAALSVTGTVTNVSCAGGSNGSIVASATGGTGSKTYVWSNGPTTAANNNLLAGSYSVTATDANGCTATQSFNVTAPSAMSVTGTVTNVACPGASTGSITASASGGTGSKTYSWSNGATGASISNLAAGSYTVTATDANGCSQSQSFTVSAPSAITITGTTNNPTCNNGSNGSISVSATGGTGSKTFTWNTGASGASISNLTAGTYTVTATDANGCTKTQNFTLTAPAAIAITGTVSNASCGSSNGSITVSASGGTGSKTFTWNTGASGATISALAAGSYTVTATDANGCTATQSFTVNSSSAVSISGNVVNASCAGGNNGSITVNITGGSGSDTYAWSNGASTANISGLAAGSYSLTVTSASGCSQTQSFTVSAPSAIAITGTVVNAACGSNNGSISVSATGGTGNKTFTWSNGASGSSISNLAAGSYTVTATDASGCTATQSFTVSAGSALTISGTSTQPTCSSSNNGSISVSATGGSGTISYSWNTGASGSALNNLGAGSYTVTATSSNGCTATQSYTLTAPAAIVVSGSVVNASCNLSNGSILASASGGTGNKTFTWNTGASGASISNLAGGTYTVTATDANGCTATQSFTVISGSSLVLSGNTTNPSCNNASNGSITVVATSGTGVITYTWNTGSTGANLSGLAAGSYTVTASDAAGCSATQSFTLTNPAPLTVNGTVVSATCYGSANGSIAVTAGGGTGNKSFAWSNGMIGQNISGLSAGNYTVTVTDAVGCSITQTFTVNQPTQIAITGSATGLSCNGLNDGSIAVNATGGTGNKTYNWNNGMTGSTISGLAAGSYTVNVSDQNGCSASQSFTVSTPSALSMNLIDFDIACNDLNGSAQVSPAGGTSPYTVSWSNGASGNASGDLSAGIYSVTLTDANGCAIASNFEITASSNLSVFINTQEISCNGANDGMLEVVVNGGDQNYTYIWSNGGETATIGVLGAGAYSVNVTDGAGCSGTASAELIEPQLLSASIAATDVSCFGEGDGIAEAIITGGNLPYTIEWSNGGSGTTATFLEPGTYTINVTDAHGCQISQTAVIEEPAMLTADILSILPESCAGMDGSAFINVEGGSPGYEILWNNGAVSAGIENAAAGSYIASITDANGCQASLNVEIPYDCVLNIPPTQLVASDCNATDLSLAGVISCDPVENADQYQWRFITQQGMILGDAYTETPYFFVSAIPGLAPNTTFIVAVKAEVNGNWGAFGDFCSILTETDLSDYMTSLTDEDCGSTVINWGDVLEAIEIPTVINYQWHITGPDYEWTTYTYDNQLTIETNMQLQPGVTYHVQMRCALGNGEFTVWGPSCSFTIAMSIGISEGPASIGRLAIYPNPCDGLELTFDFTALGQDADIQSAQVFGMRGELVEDITSALRQNKNGIYRHAFTHMLPSGMYILTYQINGQIREEKILVR